MHQHQQQHRLQLHQNAADAAAANDRNKFHTVPAKMMINGIIFEEADKQMTVLPMRPLLRGYNSHVTLPTRGTRGQHLVAEYCDDMSGAASGYCSDSDALRIRAATATGPLATSAASSSVKYSDIESGYMSEGGGPVAHAKHQQQMMRIIRSQLPTTIEER